jgi:hypothetical protein
MAEPTANEWSTLFGLLNSTAGQSYVSSKLRNCSLYGVSIFAGDSRLTIIVLFTVGTGVLFVASMYVLLKKKILRTSTFKDRLKVRKEFEYANLCGRLRSRLWLS